MANVITNDNIRDLVRDYVENRNNLPAWLQGIPIGDWDVSRVTNMTQLFSNFTTFNEPLTNWDVSNVRIMLHMFDGCRSFNQPLDNWNISNVTSMTGMFLLCSNFNQPLENWDVSNVRNMNDMFVRCTSFNQPLDNWNVSNVRNMSAVFDGCTSFNQPLNSWNVSNVETMVRLFKNCTSFNQPLENWNVSRVGFMTTMFEGCVAFNQDLSRWNVSRVINMMRMFRGCTSLTINPGWQINQETITTQMFLETPLQGTVLEAVQQQPAPRQPAPRQPAPRQPAQQQPAQPQGLAWEVHNAFDDLDLPKFMTVIRRENNGDSNFKDTNNVLEPVISYINSSDTSLTQEQKTRYTTNFRKHRGIIENVNEYIRGHPEVKTNTLEVIQFVLSQEPNYKDLYIETFENECMGGYSTGNRQSCTKGMFERIYMANKGTIEGLCFEELQGGTAAATTCKPVYLELYSAFTPGADIDINDIFQKWYNQFSYDAIPEGENPLRTFSVDERKRHFRNFVRQDEAITPRIWNNREFQRKLEQSIQANNIIFETLNLDAGLGRKRRKRRNSKKRQVKHIRKTMKKQRKNTMKHFKRNVIKSKTKGKY
jgi:surface protein